ncbi:MAG: methylmalonyl-CoA mutase subunit beta [Bacteroidetes bacterium]|nr:methylmalonyl-CoA mutase subunit beta [Bacteroidota bacterium]
MSEFLFKEFNNVSAKEWKQKIQFDLKGEDYNEKLIWQSNEGINVRPFYHQDDFKEEFIPIPGYPQSWKIAQEIFIENETIVNKILCDAVKRGAEAVFLTAEKDFSFEILFNEFSFSEIPIYFNFKFHSEEFILNLKQFLSDLPAGQAGKKARVYYNIDIIGNLAQTGNWFYNLKQDHTILENIISNDSTQPIIGVDTSIYQNAGANIVQQLAYALAHANEYLNHFKNKLDISSESFITFHIAIGANYFFEIAKIRALRKLYAALALEYNISENCHIIAKPSKRNKTIYDYNVNMLRTTTEYMSAVMGGSNTICSLPYDSLYHKSNVFGERIGRNQLLILKSESYFDLKDNPTDGTYYIESLTIQLAEKALSLFKNIEKNGGFLKQLKDGTIQRKIKESAEKEQKLFDSKEIVLLGTNKYPNPNDKMKNDLELFPFVKTKIRKTLIEPLLEKRLSEKIEQERLDNE